MSANSRAIAFARSAVTQARTVDEQARAGRFDVRDRSAVISEAEAALVRHIFQHLQVGSAANWFRS
jgi:hypothetical protein